MMDLTPDHSKIRTAVNSPSESAEGWLVIFTYKGHQDSVVLDSDQPSIEENLRKRKIKGGIDEIYSPGEWHYDPETLVPVPGDE